MILRILYNMDMMYLEVEDATLIFDGLKFEPATKVQRVAFVEIPNSVLTGSAPQNNLPFQQHAGEVMLGFSAKWVCDVLERGDTPPAGVVTIPIEQNTVVVVDSELSHACLITKYGTHVQYINVTNVI